MVPFALQNAFLDIFGDEDRGKAVLESVTSNDANLSDDEVETVQSFVAMLERTASERKQFARVLAEKLLGRPKRTRRTKEEIAAQAATE